MGTPVLKYEGLATKKRVWVPDSCGHWPEFVNDASYVAFPSFDGDNARELPRLESIVSDLFYNSILTVEEGANSQVMLASYGEPEGSPVKGQYYDYNMRIKKKMNDFAKDRDAARLLWEKSEQLAGIEFRLA